jgi:hypothetical protein
MDEKLTGLYVVLGIFGGFLGGTLVTRNYWMQLYAIYTKEMRAQYVKILKNFGIEQNCQGSWEMCEKDETWIKKETQQQN